MAYTKQGQAQSVCCFPITHYSRLADLFSPCCSHTSLSEAEFPGTLFSSQSTDFLSCPCTQYWGSAAWFPDSPAPLFPGCICWWQNSCIQHFSCSYWRKVFSLSLPKNWAGEDCHIQLVIDVECLAVSGKTVPPASVPNNFELQNTHDAEIFSNSDLPFIPDRKKYVN